ncbi:MAG: hypothetical protein RMM53_10735, partial [Bacteroidia bacterium]|nr:hypothetical protein [Bacteroidia bacterium]
RYFVYGMQNVGLPPQAPVLQDANGFSFQNEALNNFSRVFGMENAAGNNNFALPGTFINGHPLNDYDRASYDSMVWNMYNFGFGAHPYGISYQDPARYFALSPSATFGDRLRRLMSAAGGNVINTSLEIYDYATQGLNQGIRFISFQNTVDTSVGLTGTVDLSMQDRTWLANRRGRERFVILGGIYARDFVIDPTNPASAYGYTMRIDD